MLTTMADVVFIVDESASADADRTSEWLFAIAPQLDATLRNTNGIDVRYGLVGFADNGSGFGHSQLVDTNTSKSPFKRLWSETDHLADLQTAINNLASDADGEDGWDGIDHALAEYQIREGAVPIFVLIQGDEGRNVKNATLTHDGILAALKSKNVILTTLTVGPVDPPTAFHEPLFDLSPYGLSSDIRLLGVEADAAGNGQHTYHSFSTAGDTIPGTLPTTTSDALQVSYNGSGTGASGMVASGKSVLIGQGISDGIGSTAVAGYRAKDVPFGMSSASTILSDFSTPISYTVNGGFEFFGTKYTSVYVNANGTISFGSTFTATNNVDLSRAVDGQTWPSVPMIAALWDEFGAGAGPQVRYSITNVDFDNQADLVIEWRSFRYAGDNPPYDTLTFQAVLFANGNIRLNYVDIDSYATTVTDTTAFKTGGINATVGIWNGTPDSITLPAGKFVPGPHSINGASDGPQTSESINSYVRMAWDTGGAAWDFGVVKEFFTLQDGVNSPEANALRNAFIADLASRISGATAIGKVASADNVLQKIDYGVISPNPGADEFTADYGTPRLAPNNPVPTIDDTSNSIPFVDPGVPNPIKVNGVFKNARTASVVSPPNLPNLDLSYSLVNGAYIVELFFAEISPNVTGPGQNVFDVILEGKTVLNNYDMFDDRGRIIEFDELQLDVTEIGSPNSSIIPAGVVKRFLVHVSNVDGTAGLQIRLHGEIGGTAGLPFLNGVRILRGDPPRVTNIVLRKTVQVTGWKFGVDYSFAEQVAAGRQLRPVYFKDLDRLEIHFDSPVSVSTNSLAILGNNRAALPSTQLQPYNGIYNPTSFVAEWNLLPPTYLAAGKYALQLSVNGAGGVGLDGYWRSFDGEDENDHSPDDFSDDKKLRLLSGNGNPGTPFEFWFSVLPGDSNQDGIVFQSTNPASIPAITPSPANDADAGVRNDINGDGVRDAADSTIVNDIISSAGFANEILPFLKYGGDYLDDEIINVGRSNPLVWGDYLVWSATFGSTTDLRADGSMSGGIDGGDYNVWRNEMGKWSAWYTGSTPPPAAVVYVDFGNAPRVANVTISGSISTHAPYSFLQHDGSGEQLRTVPVGGANTVSVTFSEDVNVEAGSLRLVGLSKGGLPALAQFSYDVGTMTATWRFENWFAADQYLISVDDSVTDVEGNRLDGEWTNPAALGTVNAAVSEFPSGNGAAGGDFNFAITILPGDADRNNIFNAADVDIFEESWMSEWEEPFLFSEGDANGDGYVNSADVYYFPSIGLNLQQTWIRGDLDGDLCVDQADIDILADNLGMTGATWADGDLDGDGSVDVDDLDLAFAQFGVELSVVS